MKLGHHHEMWHTLAAVCNILPASSSSSLAATRAMQVNEFTLTEAEVVFRHSVCIQGSSSAFTVLYSVCSATNGSCFSISSWQRGSPATACRPTATSHVACMPQLMRHLVLHLSGTMLWPACSQLPINSCFWLLQYYMPYMGSHTHMCCKCQ